MDQSNTIHGVDSAERINEHIKLQELQNNLEKVEKANPNKLSSELKTSMEELRKAAESMKKKFKSINSATRYTT